MLRKTGSCWVVENWRIWLRARTSSPTRFISLSRSPTSTRMLLSVAASARTSFCSWIASKTSGGFTDPFSTRISPNAPRVSLVLFVQRCRDLRRRCLAFIHQDFPQALLRFSGLFWRALLRRG